MLEELQPIDITILEAVFDSYLRHFYINRISKNYRHVSYDSYVSLKFKIQNPASENAVKDVKETVYWKDEKGEKQFIFNYRRYKNECIITVYAEK